MVQGRHFFFSNTFSLVVIHLSYLVKFHENGQNVDISYFLASSFLTQLSQFSPLVLAKKMENYTVRHQQVDHNAAVFFHTLFDSYNR